MQHSSTFMLKLESCFFVQKNMKRMLEHEDTFVQWPHQGGGRGMGEFPSPPPTWRLCPHFSPCQKKMWQKLSQKRLPNFWIFASSSPTKNAFLTRCPSSKKKKKSGATTAFVDLVVLSIAQSFFFFFY